MYRIWMIQRIKIGMEMTLRIFFLEYKGSPLCCSYLIFFVFAGVTLYPRRIPLFAANSPPEELFFLSSIVVYSFSEKKWSNRVLRRKKEPTNVYTSRRVLEVK